MTLPSERAWTGSERDRVAVPPGRADLVLEYLPEAAFSATSDGIITFWNHAAASIFGYSSAEIVGRPAERLAGAASTLQPLIERAVREQRLIRDNDLRGRAKSGIEFDLEVSVMPLPDRKSVAVSARNVSRDKRDERRAAAEYAVTRALSESTSWDQAFRRVLAAVSAELSCAYAALWTHADREHLSCKMSWHATDRSLDEFDRDIRTVRFASGVGLPGRVWRTLAPVWIDDIAHTSNFPRAALALEADLRCAIAVPIIVGGDLFGVMEFFAREVRVRDEAVLRTMLGIGSEVGQYMLRLRAEDELRLSEQRFRTLADTATDAIVTLDNKSRIKYANHAVQHMFGYGVEDVIGRRMQILMPKRFRSGHRKGMARYLATGQKHIPWSSIELVGLHRDGREIPIEISFGEFSSGGQHLFTGIIRDITDRKQEHEALEAAVKARSDFLAAMSHELRTPLQAVIGYAGLLLAKLTGPLNEEQAQQLSRIELSAQHLLQLIDQVLDISRADAGTMRLHIEEVDLTVLIGDVCALVKPQVQAKHLKLHCTVADDPALRKARTDAQRLRQILLNLLTNAVKFTEIGSINVDLKMASDSDERVVIDVVDSGIGMAPEAAARIFEPFYQAESAIHKRAPGIGLGLSIVKQLVEILGGGVTVESAPQQGSRFRITLPLKAGPPAE